MELSEMLLTGIRLLRGRLVKITPEGEIWVENDPEGLSIPCDFLRTSSTTLPKLDAGDEVLYVVDEMGTHGYVLGVIQKYQPGEQETSGKLNSTETKQEFLEIKLNAKEKIELRCGKSSLIMDKDGKVVIRGASVTSRASGPQKIKGGTIHIN